MIKQLHFKTLLLLCALIAGSGNVWADTETLLSEDFASITTGSNTSTSGSGNFWEGNDNFPQADNSKAYPADGAIKLGGSSATGHITSKSLSVNAGTLTVSFDVKGWTTVEGDIKVTVGTQSQTVTYTAKMSSQFESKSVDFTIAESGSVTVKLESTKKRAFLDNIVVTNTYSSGSASTSITASDVNVTFDATSGTIDYTINNEPNPAGTLTAAIADGGTIADLSIGAITDSAIPFTCSANTTNVQRTATITLTYTYGTNETVTKNVTITQAANPYNNISDITAVNTAYKVKGTVVAVNSRGFVIGDGTGYIYTYLDAAPTQSVGDMVSISGTTGSYGHIIQFKNTATIEAVTSSNYDNTPAIAVLDADGMAAYNSDFQKSDYVQLEGTLNSNYEITVGTSKARISYPNVYQTTSLNDLLNKEVCVKGYFAGFNSSSTFTIMMESVEEIVRDAYTLTVKVSNGSVEITGKTLTDGSCEVSEGVNVTATATPAEHYTFTSWTATGVTLTDGTANPLVFTMPSNAVTLTANFTEKAKHTVTFYANGSEIDTDADVYEGDAITFPASPAIVLDKVFVGWSSSDIVGSTNTAPDFVTNAIMGTNDMTFYAVFAAKTETIESGSKEFTITNTEFCDNLSGSYATATITKTIDGVSYNVELNACEQKSMCQLRDNATLSYIHIPELPGYITNVSTSKCANASGASYNGIIHIKSSKTRGNSDADDITKAELNSVTSFSIDVTGEHNSFYLLTSAGLRLNDLTVTYTGNVTKINYSGYCTSVSTTGTITLNAACKDGNVIYGTYNTDRAYVMPKNMVGQVVKVGDDGVLVVKDAYEEDEVVPANTALLLYTIDEFTGTKDYTITYTSEVGADKSGDNMLKGTLTADDMTEGDNCLFYRLTMHNGTQIGFWWGADDGGAFKPGANKAYLAVPQSSGNAGSRQGFRIGGNVTTAISGVAERENADAAVYNLQGQRVQGGVKGIVIQNGKKFINK